MTSTHLKYRSGVFDKELQHLGLLDLLVYTDLV
jgi:hypothetical protein